MPRGSYSASPRAALSRSPVASAAWRRPRSSPISAPDQRANCRTWRARRVCSTDCAGRLSPREQPTSPKSPMLEMQRQSSCAAVPKTPGVVMDNRNSQQGPAVSVDPFAPGEIATRLEAANVSRAALSARSLILLGLLGGLYIGFGGALATLVLTDNALGFGLGRFVAGLSFSL